MWRAASTNLVAGLGGLVSKARVTYSGIVTPHICALAVTNYRVRHESVFLAAPPVPRIGISVFHNGKTPYPDYLGPEIARWGAGKSAKSHYPGTQHTIIDFLLL